VKQLNLKPEELEIVGAILARHVPDREVRAFGSRVAGPAKKFSDLDLAVMGETSLPASVLADLEEDFRESDLPFKVDVVDWATTKESFRRIIEREYVVVQRELNVTVYSGHKGSERPKSFLIDGKTVEVLAIAKMWVEEDRDTRKRKRFFMVKGSDGKGYTLYYDEISERWHLKDS